MISYLPIRCQEGILLPLIWQRGSDLLCQNNSGSAGLTFSAKTVCRATREAPPVREVTSRPWGHDKDVRFCERRCSCRSYSHARRERHLRMAIRVQLTLATKADFSSSQERNLHAALAAGIA